MPATLKQIASLQMDLTDVNVELDSLEMELHAQVNILHNYNNYNDVA